MREVRKKSSWRVDAPRRRERLVKIHMRRMWFWPQRVQHGDFHAANFFQRVAGDFLAVAQIREPLFSALHKKIAVRRHRAVRQGQGDDFQIAERERRVNDVWFGMKISLRNRATVKGV